MANMISSFLDPGEAYSRAEQASREGYGEAKGYQEPFRQGGLDQYGRLNQATGDLLNPEALQSKWASGYESSPYAQQLLKQNQASGLDTASSMGLSGSSAALGNIQQGAGNIVQADRQKYLDDLMQKYMHGIGLGQSLYGTGASAATNLAHKAVGQGDTQAGLQYGRYNAPGEMFGKLLGQGVSAATGGLGNLAEHGDLGSYGHLFNSGNKFNAYIPPNSATA